MKIMGWSQVPGKRINSPLGSSLKMVLSLHWTVWDLEVGQTQTHSLLALVILIWVHWLNWMMRKIMSGRNYIRRKRRKGSQSCRIPKHQEIWFSHNRTEIDLWFFWNSYKIYRIYICWKLKTVYSNKLHDFLCSFGGRRAIQIFSLSRQKMLQRCFPC